MTTKGQGDDRELVETIRHEFTPGPLSPAKRAQLRQGIDQRLARRRRGWIVTGVLAGAATAALAAWLVLVPPGMVRPAVEPETSLALDAWTESVLFEETAVDDDDLLLGDEELMAGSAGAEADDLPAEYEVLAALVDG